MLMLTQVERKALPPLRSQDGKPEDAVVVQVKYFTPDSNWTWLATEFDGEDMFYGLVCGFANELGYFRLSELSGDARGPQGYRVERDRHFVPITLAEARERYANG